jgi:YD repeat-containing protein
MTAAMLLALIQHSAIAADPLCGPSIICKPESIHNIATVNESDGLGTTYTVYNKDSAGLVLTAKEACVHYADAHSTSAYYDTFDDTCQPALPIPQSGVGGSSGSISVSGTLRQIRRSDGAILSTSTSTWAMLNAFCDDSLDSTKRALGNDGQCYCNAGYSWQKALNACVVVTDPLVDYCPECMAKRLAEEKRYGNPIAPLIGAKIQFESLGVDIGKQALVAAYDSRTKAPFAVPPMEINGDIGIAATPAASLGGLWTTNAHKSLYIQRLNTANTGFVVQAYRGDGRIITFQHPTTTTYTPVNPAVREQLLPVLDSSGNQTSQVRLVDTSGNIELYDMHSLSTGWRADLLSVSYIDGGGITYGYSGGLLVWMTDDQGRGVRFDYDPVGNTSRLKQLITSDGRVTGFGYDTQGNFAQITWPDGKTRKFLYERTDFPWALTGVIDELNNRFSTFTYDDVGRAIATEHAGGVDSYSVSYASAPMRAVTETRSGNVITRTHGWVMPQDVNVTMPNSSRINLGVGSVGGMPLSVGESQAAGSGNAESGSAVAYDSAGNIASSDDFNAVRTCYAYDSSNRETTRVEGLANSVACSSVTPSGATLPSGARKITTTWHPDWRLPVQVTRPLSKSTIVYHGQSDPFNGNATANCTSAANLPNGNPLPLVCKRVEQATLSSGALDSSVPSNSVSYTYDAGGHMLTSADVNGHTTTFAYFTDSAFEIPFDPYLNSVVLLVQGDGPNGTTTIADHSPSAKTLAAHGNAQVSTAQSYYGGSSLLLDGNGDYVDSVSTISDFAFGTGDFTIEFFARKSTNGVNNYDIAIGTYTSSNASNGYWVELSATRGFFFAGTAGGGAGSVMYAQYNSSPNDSTWHHWAIARSGTSLKLFKDGVVVASATNSVNLPAATLQIGTDPYSEFFNGYLQMRITKGVARYTANFTPPTQFPFGTLTSASLGHRPGQLQSVTNPAGQVTQYTKYDPTGHVRQMIDPKGVVTDTTYTARGLVSTVTITPPSGAARTTTYTYDDVGQVTGVALPDGTTLTYGYDTAHRLTNVADVRGNSVTYTLDNAGNRTVEEIRDTGGTLQRSIGRSFDAINRVQQVTGAAQ